jgi:hypothetical protein
LVEPERDDGSTPYREKSARRGRNHGAPIADEKVVPGVLRLVKGRVPPCAQTGHEIARRVVAEPEKSLPWLTCELKLEQLGSLAGPVTHFAATKVPASR